ncbi:fumarate reductase cytochrome b subunit [Campylobacter mucosalis]|uniref:Fumarate reductase cytochrome b subunit n=1 Tax=Campylobacter mucosalis CCUG 21559 TaxID=1032067 RepID=A0A6G5QFX2_9BACT|nr:fumarate reductase cytochrome b subunit [Campylobacter mucosalis]KEA46106.1 fumarate reductase [Campylobacter mucosalis]QCD44585.1 fumarate reductase, cytochrome b subunit [Campylobacter mucosalis CCUG 21559]QKF62551.1 fumarate reductase, cytochrome b subunit [Campylobacter mucosalis]
MSELIEGFLGKRVDTKKSRLPATWDRWQSITGFILACFILCHMVFTSTILLGKDAFNAVVGFAEAKFLFGEATWWITNVIAAVIFVVFITHAFLAMRKFPANYRQYKMFIGHKNRIKHNDTTLWWFQFLTGFALFFAASAHLVDIVFGGHITADNSAANFKTLEFFYLALLVFMVVHAGVGMYRLYVKWVSIDGANKHEMFENRKKAKVVVFAVFGVLAVIALIADFVWISLGH